MATDLAIGFNAYYINQAIEQLYQNKSVRNSLFKGSESIDILGENIVIAWEVQTTPIVVLRSPTYEEWNDSIKGDGYSIQQFPNAFITTFPQFQLNISGVSMEKSATFSAKAICSTAISEQTISLTIEALISQKISSLSP